MTGFLLGLALGLFVGTLIGMFTIALMQAAKEREVDAIFARHLEDLAARQIDVPLPRREPQ